MNLSLDINVLSLVLMMFNAYFFYSLPFIKKVVREPVGPSYQKRLLIRQGICCVLLMITLECFYRGLHHHSLLDLSWQEWAALGFCIIALVVGIKKLVLKGLTVIQRPSYGITVIDMSGSRSQIFDSCSAGLIAADAEIILESPDQGLIIAKLLIAGSDLFPLEKRQECALEVTVSDNLVGTKAVQIICYPARKAVFVEKRVMQQFTVTIAKQLQNSHNEVLDTFF